VNQLFEWLSKFVSSWKFWIVVPPWDIGVRVRLGKNATALAPGPHLRIPFVDQMMLVNTRLRVASTPPVTLGGSNGKSRVVSAVVGYRVKSPLVSLLHFEHPDIAVQAYVQAELAKLTSALECQEAMTKEFERAGIEIEFVRYAEDVEVQTIRLLQNSWGITSQQYSPPQAVPTDPRY